MISLPFAVIMKTKHFICKKGKKGKIKTLHNSESGYLEVPTARAESIIAVIIVQYALYFFHFLGLLETGWQRFKQL